MDLFWFNGCLCLDIYCVYYCYCCCCYCRRLYYINYIWCSIISCTINRILIILYNYIHLFIITCKTKLMTERVKYTYTNSTLWKSVKVKVPCTHAYEVPSIVSPTQLWQRKWNSDIYRYKLDLIKFFKI